MSSNDCSGYHWSQGQYTLSNCTQESSTFFIILGFTMLVLVLLLFIIVVIACVRRQRIRTRALQLPPLAQGNQDDCVINVDGSGQTGGSLNGRNMDNVKTVIMAGEEKPTFIAHPVRSILPSCPPASTDDKAQEANPGEVPKQVQHEVT